MFRLAIVFSLACHLEDGFARICLIVRKGFYFSVLLPSDSLLLVPEPLFDGLARQAGALRKLNDLLIRPSFRFHLIKLIKCRLLSPCLGLQLYFLA